MEKVSYKRRGLKEKTKQTESQIEEKVHLGQCFFNLFLLL
ncbi:hypothetical protein ScFU53_01660 [Streptococcus canis]|nr:hypothetical protein ScFU1_01010 [Streptococcus canis]GFE47944.1 hypothetical protein ScFU129_15750 [Streptococcus canis]GFG43154.1 hypothetical protein ScFU53_01660 [Streptococcus canis]